MRPTSTTRVGAMPLPISIWSLVLVFIVASVARSFSQSGTELAQLQNNFAMRYLDPAAHMALARYYLNQGDRREAFFTLEAARRGTFEEAVFDQAFQQTFGGFDNSKAGEEKLLSELAQSPQSADLQFQLADIYISRSDYVKGNELLRRAIKDHPEDFRFTAGLTELLRIQGKSAAADLITDDYVRKYPESAAGYELRAQKLQQTGQSVRQLLDQGLAKFPNDGSLTFRLAALLQETGDLDKAEAAYVKAAALAPKSVGVQSWVGRFFFKVRQDNRRALPYYLNAYFLSPHAYETEFVESRLRNIFFVAAQTDFQDQIKAKKPLTELLKDENPAVVELALTSMDQAWQPSYIDPVIALMGHEDQGVRWDATQLLKQRVDSDFDPKLKALLKDNDLRKRGLAAYIAVYRWKSASFPFMDELLAEQAQLLRFDALSALILEGGPAGKAHALAHAAK